MAGFLVRFRKNVISSLRKDKANRSKVKNIDGKIALGILLWVTGAVAEADDEFFPEEGKKIKEILVSRLKISEQDFPIVLTAIRQAAIEKVDFYRFVQEVNENLAYDTKILVVGDLFRIAHVDKKLADREYEIIRKISDLFRITDRDFTDVKIKTEKEKDGV